MYFLLLVADTLYLAMLIIVVESTKQNRFSYLMSAILDFWYM